MMLCNYRAIFMKCTATYLILPNQFLANFEMSELPFLMNMSCRIRMSWSLEAWMKHRASSFSWNSMHKHNIVIIQYIKLGHIKYFIFSEKVSFMFKFGIIIYNEHCMLLLIMKFFQVCEMCATLCYICVVDIGVKKGIVTS